MNIEAFVLDLETESGETNKKLFAANPYNFNNKIIAIGSLIINEGKVVPEILSMEDCNNPKLNFGGKEHNFVIGCNLSFDMGYMLRMNAVRETIEKGEISLWDISLADYINSGQRNLYPSLDAMANEFSLETKIDALGPVKYVLIENGMEFNTLNEVDRDILEEYLTHDLMTTKQIFEEQIKYASPLLTVEMAARLTTIVMEYNGMYFDEEQAQIKLREIKEAEKKLLNKIYKEYANRMGIISSFPDTFKPLSNTNISSFIFGGLIEYKEKKLLTDEEGNFVQYKSGPNKGTPRLKCINITHSLNAMADSKHYTAPTACGFEVSEKVLNNVLNGKYTSPNTRAFIKYILEIKALTKIRSTYLEPISSMIRANTMVHPTINHTSTATRRLSCVKPNMQNIPAKDTIVKSCFKTRFKNGTLIELDYDALELKNLAHLSNDMNLISVLSDPKRDIHQEAADEYGISRDCAKTFHYMLIYGASVKAIAKELKVTNHVAKRLIKRFFDSFPGVKILYEKWKWEVMLNENINPDGCVSYYSPDETEAMYHFKSSYGNTSGLPAVKNYANQGLGGTLIKIALSKILSDENIRPHIFTSILPIMTIHDSNLFDVDLDVQHYHKVRDWLGTSMTTGVEDSYESLFGVKLRVPLTVTVKCATVWSEMKEV